MAHVLQRLVHIHYQRILFATVGYKVVAAQLGGVVIGNLLFDARAFDTRISREQLVFTGSVGKVVTDIPCHRQLSIQGKDLRIGLAALSHVHAGCCLYIGQKVLTLVRGDIFVHVA